MVLQNSRFVTLLVADRPLAQHDLQMMHEHREQMYRISLGIQSLAHRFAVDTGTPRLIRRYHLTQPSGKRPAELGQ